MLFDNLFAELSSGEHRLLAEQLCKIRESSCNNCLGTSGRFENPADVVNQGNKVCPSVSDCAAASGCTPSGRACGEDLIVGDVRHSGSSLRRYPARARSSHTHRSVRPAAGLLLPYRVSAIGATTTRQAC